MANGVGGLGYLPRESPVHRLTGASKLILVVLASLAAMLTYDTRLLLGIIVGSLFMFKLGRVKFSELKVIILLMMALLFLNNLFIYLFSPEEGVNVYGTRHVLLHIAGRYSITAEQLFYHLNVTLKYFSILPVALIFFVTTEPSEFASSLNAIGASYKVSYSVALALRYIPDVRREYHEISRAQQARGIDLSRGVSFIRRIRGAVAIIFPLILSSLDRIETISNAMELRSFGKNKKRTWYRARPFRPADYVVVGIGVLLLVLVVVLNFVNGGRFYNPFV